MHARCLTTAATLFLQSRSNDARKNGGFLVHPPLRKAHPEQLCAIGTEPHRHAPTVAPGSRLAGSAPPAARSFHVVLWINLKSVRDLAQLHQNASVFLWHSLWMLLLITSRGVVQLAHMQRSPCRKLASIDWSELGSHAASERVFSLAPCQLAKQYSLPPGSIFCLLQYARCLLKQTCLTHAV